MPANNLTLSFSWFVCFIISSACRFVQTEFLWNDFLPGVEATVELPRTWYLSGTFQVKAAESPVWPANNVEINFSDGVPFERANHNMCPPANSPPDNIRLRSRIAHECHLHSSFCPLIRALISHRWSDQGSHRTYSLVSLCVRSECVFEAKMPALSAAIAHQWRCKSTYFPGSKGPLELGRLADFALL